jgi:transmembrane E3 ubiquitin-protein ligase
VQTYDYHPVMPVADPESPEQSLGDCAICMDAIRLDRSHHRSESSDGIEMGELGGKGKSKGMGVGLLNAMQKGVRVGARKNYSLAPCYHLFVS